MTNKEQFDALLPLYLIEYERTTGKPYPNALRYEHGYIRGWSAGNKRVSDFEKAYTTLARRPDFGAEEETRTGMRVLHKRWFTSQITIGAIVAENSNGDRNVYIGAASGHDEGKDTQHILEWGSKVDLKSFVVELKRYLLPIKPDDPFEGKIVTYVGDGLLLGDQVLTTGKQYKVVTMWHSVEDMGKWKVRILDDKNRVLGLLYIKENFKEAKDE